MLLPTCPARLRHLVPFLTLLCLSVLGRAAGANTLNVPTQYSNIQAAINASVSGDTVLISDGTYTGPGNVDLDFGGRNITVTSVNGAATTIIDCGASNHRGFYFHSGEVSAVVSRLTVQNGYVTDTGSGQPANTDGAGILNSSVGVTITNCVFKNNRATSSDGNGFGGAICNLGNGMINITGCTITGNAAEEGGGVYNSPTHGGTVTLTNCVLSGNTSYTGGGGLYTTTGNRGTGGSTVTLAGCTLIGNSAAGGILGNGGGVFIDNGTSGDTVSLTGCTVANNTASYYGGGVYSLNFGTVSLTHCTVSGNTASLSADGAGGGVFIDNYAGFTMSACTVTANNAYQGAGVFNNNISGNVALTNCAVSNNRATQSGGGIYNFSYNNGQVSVTNCSLTANTAPLGAGVCNLNSNGGQSFLTNDVLYNDAGGEFANDTGNSAPCNVTHCDILGGVPSGTADGGGNINAPPQFANAPTDLHLQAGSPCLGAGTASGAPTATLDGRTRPNPPAIGAYEVSSIRYVPAEYGTIQAAINASVNGDTVLISDGTYAGLGNVDLDLGGRNITVTSVNGAATTIIDCGGYNHRGFYLHSGETSAVISGLTIKNGNVYGYGGGIVNASVGLIVQNCVIKNNTAVYGGGIANFNGGTLTVIGCTLTSNSAPTGSGGGLYNNSSGGTANVTNCTFTGNSAAGSGGGLFNETTGSGTINVDNCTFTANTAQYGGSGIYNYNSGSGTTTATNDILYGDVGGELAGSAIAVNYCDIQGGYQAGHMPFGDIDADPLFVVTPSDLHLQPGSPCLGVGKAYGAPATDQDGRTRPSPPSLGAYELAGTHFVPTQYATIQAAINASFNDDTVLISDGTYSGPGNVDLDFAGRNITVTSQNGAAKTVIDCGGFASGNGSGDHRGFYLHTGEASAVISGLTIENGYISGNNPSGGGVQYNGGGGILDDGVSVTIQSCILKNNTAVAGGGLYNHNSNGGTITETNCVITGNTGIDGGGGINNYNDGVIAITNCTLTGNSAPTGGGISSYNYGGTFNLTNDILYGDTGGEVGGSVINVSSCDIQTGYTGTGNIDADPLFVNSPTDLHLRPGSPCLGAGSASGAPATTIDGVARPNPPAIGAYEAAVRAATTTALTSSLNPSASGQSVTFTANIAGTGGGTPTGTVTFTVDGMAQTPVPVSNGYYAAYNTSPLAVGSHAVTAAYSGNANFAPSASSTLTQTVLAATSVTVANATGAAGQAVTLSATLAKTSGPALSGATLSFSVDGTPVGTALTNSSGVATLRYVVPSALAVGGHTVAAAFSGDGGDAASSGGGALTVTKGGVALAVAAAVGSPGQAVTLKATLKRVSDGALLGGETVSFSVDGAVVGTAVTNSAGLAVLTYTVPANAALGGHALAAAFAGDGAYNAGTGRGTLTVKAATQIAVANVSGARGTTVTLSATLTTSSGAPVSGKTLAFKIDGSNALGTAVTDSTGTATLPYAIPAGSKVGAHSVGVSFAGDSGDAPSSNKGTLTVN